MFYLPPIGLLTAESTCPLCSEFQIKRTQRQRQEQILQKFNFHVEFKAHRVALASALDEAYTPNPCPQVIYDLILEFETGIKAKRIHSYQVANTYTSVFRNLARGVFRFLFWISMPFLYVLPFVKIEQMI